MHGKSWLSFCSFSGFPSQISGTIGTAGCGKEHEGWLILNRRRQRGNFSSCKMLRTFQAWELFSFGSGLWCDGQDAVQAMGDPHGSWLKCHVGLSLLVIFEKNKIASHLTKLPCRWPKQWPWRSCSWAWKTKEKSLALSQLFAGWGSWRKREGGGEESSSILKRWKMLEILMPP